MTDIKYVHDNINNFPSKLNEEHFLSNIVNKIIGGSLENGDRFNGVLKAFNDIFLLLEDKYEHQILIRRKNIVNLFVIRGGVDDQ